MEKVGMIGNMPVYLNPAADLKQGFAVVTLIGEDQPGGQYHLVTVKNGVHEASYSVAELRTLAAITGIKQADGA